MDPKALDAYHERLGIKAPRHPFLPAKRGGQETDKCAACVFSKGHATHSGAEVVSLDQFRSRRQR